jgi:hypothetical protein
VNGHPGGRLLVDTGSPFTLIDPSAFPGTTLPRVAQVNVDIGLGALTVDGVSALQLMGSGMMDMLALGGILGGNVLRSFSTQFDYRDQALRLGAGADPGDVALPGTSLPFELQGGGSASDGTTIVTFPATRIALTVNVDGVDHPFILDSGASQVAVRTSLFDTLTADGRAQRGGFPVQTAAGPANATLTRARALAVAGEQVTDVAVMTIGDDLLDNITAEVHHPVDGLLGGTFLREFLVTIDYPKRTLHLQRYATRDHIVDELQRVGIELGGADAGGGMTIATVYAGTDAALKGLTISDQLLAVDGQPLDTLNPIDADLLLDGAVGSTHALTFGRATTPANANSTVTVRVDDLVPAPN